MKIRALKITALILAAACSLAGLRAAFDFHEEVLYTIGVFFELGIAHYAHKHKKKGG